REAARLRIARGPGDHAATRSHRGRDVALHGQGAREEGWASEPDDVGGRARIPEPDPAVAPGTASLDEAAPRSGAALRSAGDRPLEP
ncbi:MAG TPA: hypothetical protein VF453_11340, partial [Burkholderiaceae bacterium]